MFRIWLEGILYCSRLDWGAKRNHYKECRNGVLLRAGQVGVSMGSCSLETVQNMDKNLFFFRLEQVVLGTGSVVKLSLFLVGIALGERGFLFLRYHS